MSLTEEEQNYSIDKKIHFTYKEKIDMSSLCQEILSKENRLPSRIQVTENSRPNV